MRKSLGLLFGLALLGGCGAEEEPPRKADDDAKDVAMVERLNQPPFRPIRPEPFVTDDVDRYDLARDGCMFRPGTKPDEAPLFIAQKDRGYLKLGGKLLPLAVKSGSAELPSGAHSTYVGTSNWVELVAQAGESGKALDGSETWPSRLVIHDANERVAFDSLGQVACAPSGTQD